MIVKIQHRRGDYAYYDPTRVLPGELVVVQGNDPNSDDGKAIYICTVAGDVRRLITESDLESEVSTQILITLQDRIDELIEDIREEYSELSDDVDQLKNALTLNLTSSMNKNLIGREKNVYYRVFIPAGASFVISTSDGSNVASNVKIAVYDKNKTYKDFYNLLAGTNARLVNLNVSYGDIHYLVCESDVAVPLQIEIGTQKTPYTPYVGTIASRYEDITNAIIDLSATVDGLHTTMLTDLNMITDELINDSISAFNIPCVYSINNHTINDSGKITTSTGNKVNVYDISMIPDNVCIRVSYMESYGWFAEIPINENIQTIDETRHLLAAASNVSLFPIDGTKYVAIRTASSDSIPTLSTANIGLQIKRDFIQYSNYIKSQSCIINADGTVTVPAGGYYFVGYDLRQLKGDGKFVIKVSPYTQISVYKSANANTGGSNGYGLGIFKDGEATVIIEKASIDSSYPYAIVRVDNRDGSSTVTVYDIQLIDSYVSIPNTPVQLAYVSPLGNDSNNGSELSPFATVNHALISGAKTIMLKGGIYKQQIDLSNTQYSHVELRCADSYNRVIFKDPDCVLATSETLESGYENVYKVPISATIATNNKWLYQEGVPDASTLIDDDERLPLQRGYAYRCEDTKIDKCTSTVLADALSEIENSDTYKWFSDGSYVYFSRPQTITTQNPLCIGLNKTLFLNGTKRHSLKAIGIEVKYMTFNVNNMSNAEILECKASNVYDGGAFRYDKCQSVKFVRCEAVRCQTGSNGDGFNGHADISGDVFSKQVCCAMIDCWSHDNQDDGYSDHERSETMIIGGLFEYNGKGGVVPSYGSHCTCYDVISRNNYNGFYYIGTVLQEEGGKYGQILCINCLAESNTGIAGFRVSGTGNLATLIDCRAIGNAVGYYCESNAYMRLIDCRTKGNTTVKTDQAGNHIIVDNTTVVE